jgi:hypothetical protein
MASFDLSVMNIRLASDDSIEDYREYNAVLRASSSSSSENTYLLNK